VVAPSVSIKDRIVLARMVNFDLYKPFVRFLWGPKNLVAIELLCRAIPPYFKVVCWRENVAAQDDGWVRHCWESRLYSGSRDPISI
jgi:hypothetical protein